MTINMHDYYDSSRCFEYANWPPFSEIALVHLKFGIAHMEMKCVTKTSHDSEVKHKMILCIVILWLRKSFDFLPSGITSHTSQLTQWNRFSPGIICDVTDTFLQIFSLPVPIKQTLIDTWLATRYTKNICRNVSVTFWSQCILHS